MAPCIPEPLRAIASLSIRPYVSRLSSPKKLPGHHVFSSFRRHSMLQALHHCASHAPLCHWTRQCTAVSLDQCTRRLLLMHRCVTGPGYALLCHWTNAHAIGPSCKQIFRRFGSFSFEDCAHHRKTLSCVYSRRRKLSVQLPVQLPAELFECLMIFLQLSAMTIIIISVRVMTSPNSLLRPYPQPQDTERHSSCLFESKTNTYTI